MVSSQPSTVILSAQVNGIFLSAGTQFSDSVKDKDLLN
jgi:hypothetical protein